MSQIFGREREKQNLQATLDSSKAEFLAVYGRRRVGKTHLVRHFYSNTTKYFEMTGSKKAPLREQLLNFKHAFAKTFASEETLKTPANWTEAMMLLKDAVEAAEENRKITLFFDEVPWIASPRSGFLPALEHLWNRYLSQMDNVILVICGSAASWMIKKVVNNRGGLYGRLTGLIHLKPFNLSQTESFLKQLGIDLDRRQLVDLYMALGGIAKYHTFVKRGQSAAQNIQNLIFNPDGLMHDEFNRLFESLFDHNKRHHALIETLSKKRAGYSQSDLIQRAGISLGGHSAEAIHELEQSGFITYVPHFGKKKTGGAYRLTDEYSLFHLHWLEPLAQKSIADDSSDYWMQMQNSKSWLSWAGYAFESICLKHIKQIKAALGIASVISFQTGWKAGESPSVEIDLLIDRNDRCINLCEIKYSEGPYTVTKSYAEQLRRKKQRFIEETSTRKAVLVTLITPYGVKPNTHSNAVVDQEVTLDSLFQ